MAHVAAVAAAATATAFSRLFIFNSVGGGLLHDHFFAGSRDGEEWLLPWPALGMDSDSSLFDIGSMGLLAALSIPRGLASAVGAEGNAGRLGSVVGADGAADDDVGSVAVGGAGDGPPLPHAVSIVTSATPVSALRT